MHALVPLHPAQAGNVAAHTAADGPGLPSAHLFGPGGVGDELPAHRRAIDAPAGQLPFHKIRRGKPAHPADRQFRAASHQVAVPQKAPLPAEIRVIGRRDGVAQVRVVGQGHVKAGRPCPLQQRHEHRQLLQQHARIAVVGGLLAHCQFIINGHARRSAAHRGHRLGRKARPPRRAASVGVGAVVEQRRGKAAAHPVAVHLDHIEPRLLCQLCGPSERGRNGPRLFGGHPGHQLFRLPVQQRPQLLFGNSAAQNARQIPQHGFEIAVRLMELCADQAALCVYQLTEPFVMGGPFFTV